MSKRYRCFCLSHGCAALQNGAHLDYHQWRAHQRHEDDMDGLAGAIMGLALTGPRTEQYEHSIGEPMQSTGTVCVDQSLISGASHPKELSRAQPFNPHHHDIHLNWSADPLHTNTSDSLFAKMSALARDIKAHQDSLAATDDVHSHSAYQTINRKQLQSTIESITQELCWLQRALAVVKLINVPSYSAPHILHLRDDMARSLQQNIKTLTLRLEAKQKVAGAAMIFNTNYIPEHLWRSNPVVLGVMIIVMVLHCLDGVPYSTCNFILQGMKLILKSQTDQLDENRGCIEQDLVQRIPGDMRTVESRFNLKPSMITYACCPSCCALYAPTEEICGVKTYPSRCSKMTYGQKACETRLTKFLIQAGKNVKVPIRPFIYRPLTEFVAQLFSNESNEEAMDNAWVTDRHEGDSCIYDIFDGSVISMFRGRDDKMFKKPIGTNAHLIWTLNVDWFNPYHNKIAGKKASFGVILMACLNLPPHLRYKSENMHLAGIIPGPQEPSGHQINHFLSPLVDEMEQCWHGIWHNRTSKCPRGRLVISALIPVISDVPAARKTSGTTSHSAKRFCHLCMLDREHITDLKHWKWLRRDRATHLALAKQWLNLPKKTQRDKFFKTHGVRWTELLRLPYWDPTSYVVVDPMHNLFLGLIRHHFRVVLGTDDRGYEGQDAPRPIEAQPMETSQLQ